MEEVSKNRPGGSKLLCLFFYNSLLSPIPRYAIMRYAAICNLFISFGPVCTVSHAVSSLHTNKH